MPVRDRQTRRLIRLGIIRLGYRKKIKKGNKEIEIPVQSDCFLLHDAPEIEAFYIAKEVKKVRELDVLLPFPDIDRNFSAYYEVWAGGIRVCQGDGEYVTDASPFRATVDADGTVRVKNAPGDMLISNGIAQRDFTWNGSEFKQGDLVPCPGKDADAYTHCGACGLSCLMKVMMADPELFRMGYYQIATRSKRNHDTIMGTLEMFPANKVNGIPFKLRMVEEQNIYLDENGQRRKGKKWFLQLEPEPGVTRKLYQRRTERMIDAPMLTESTEIEGPVWDEVEEEAPPPFAEVQSEEVEIIEAEETTAETEESESEGGNSNKSPHDTFWHAVRKVGMTRDDGLHLLAECKDDFAIALKRLRQEFPV
jgi:hypothetical protein